MQRRSFLKKAGLGAVASTAAIAAPAIAQSNPKVNWKLTSTYGPATPALFSTAQSFCKMVEEASDGNFNIRLYPAILIAPFTPLHGNSGLAGDGQSMFALGLLQLVNHIFQALKHGGGDVQKLAACRRQKHGPIAPFKQFYP